MKLWADTKDRRKYEDLSDLFAIFKTTEHLEAAYVRDAITPEQVCSHLLRIVHLTSYLCLFPLTLQ